MRCDRCPDPSTCGGCDPVLDAVCDPDACCGDPWRCEREVCPEDGRWDYGMADDGAVYVVDLRDDR